jgi:type II secretory pathway component PulL
MVHHTDDAHPRGASLQEKRRPRKVRKDWFTRRQAITLVVLAVVAFWAFVFTVVVPSLFS